MKVIAHLRDGKLIKGHTDALPSNDIDQLLRDGPVELPSQVRLRAEGSREAHRVALDSLKALFFVKTFEGCKSYNEIRFFDAHPPVPGLWVRLKYYDGEAGEGVVHNSLHHLVQPGFFLKPPDPHSNNQMVYVLKSSLVDFQVLGVRSSY